MPTTDLTRNLFAVSGGQGAAQWGSVEGGVISSFQADAQLRRGVNLALGLDAVAHLDASFRRFIAAELDAQAEGSLRLRGQVQAPINLFRETGVAVRLQAVAELAAGVRLSLGLSVGDFLDLVKQDPAMDGLPYRLFEIFLEEVTIGAGLYAKAALSAMAYANVVISGSLLPRDGEGPGFRMLAEAGVGLKAGSGYRLFARAGIDDVRRLVARTTDVLVDELAVQIGERLPRSDRKTRLLLSAMRAPAKIALRTAYEVGELLGTRQVPQTGAGQAILTQRIVQVILEETQRFVLAELVAVAAGELEAALRGFGISQQQWTDANAVRTQLGDRLLAMPADPFAPTAEVIGYWQQVVNDAVAVMDRFGPRGEPWQLGLSIIWAATDLLFAATQRMRDAGAAADAIDLAPAVLHAAFTGAVRSAPPPAVAAYVNAALGRDATDTLRREDLVVFLLDDVVIDLLTAGSPGVDRFLGVFESFPGGRRAFLREALSTYGALRFSADGQVDPAQTLVRLAAPLRTFLHSALRQELSPAIRPHLSDRPDLILYLDEVVIPSLGMAVDVAFDRAQRWGAGGVDAEALTEALSSVILSLVGRSVVVTTDVLANAALGEIQGLLHELAGRADGQGGLGEVLRQLAPPGMRDDVGQLVEDVLRIGGDAFAPLPPTQRAVIRQLLYDVLGAAVADDPVAYAEALEDPLLIPSAASVTRLAEELGRSAVSTLERFVRALLLELARVVLREIREQVDGFEQMVQRWVDETRRAVTQLEQQLEVLRLEIARLVKEAQALLAAAASEVQAVLGFLGQASTRESMRTAVADRLAASALAGLGQNLIYKALPTGVKATAQALMRDAIRAAVLTPIATPVWNALGGIALGTGDLIAEVRAFNPQVGVGKQLRALIIRRIEDRVRGAFGADPGIDLEFTVSWVVDVGLARHEFRETIDLGRIDFPVEHLVAALHTLFEPMVALDAVVQPLAATLASYLRTEAELSGAAGDESARLAQLETARATVQQAPVGEMAIRVSEPAPAAVYESDVPFRIDIIGAPLEFMGRSPGEQQRVVVWLNEQVLDLGAFGAAVIEPAVESPTTAIFSARQLMGNGAGVLSARERSGVSVMRSAMRTDIAEPGSGPSGDGAGMDERAHRAGVSRILDTQRRHEVEALRTRQIADASPMAAALAQGDLVITGAGATTPMRAVRPERAIPLGRRPDQLDLAALDADPRPSLRITGTIPVEGLPTGINSIVVAVSDGCGTTAEASATFIVSRPEPEVEPELDVRLPSNVLRPMDTHARVPLEPLARAAARGHVFRTPRRERAEIRKANAERMERMRATVVDMPRSAIRQESAS